MVRRLWGRELTYVCILRQCQTVSDISAVHRRQFVHPYKTNRQKTGSKETAVSCSYKSLDKGKRKWLYVAFFKGMPFKIGHSSRYPTLIPKRIWRWENICHRGQSLLSLSQKKWSKLIIINIISLGLFKNISFNPCLRERGRRVDSRPSRHQ